MVILEDLKISMAQYGLKLGSFPALRKESFLTLFATAAGDKVRSRLYQGSSTLCNRPNASFPDFVPNLVTTTATKHHDER